MKSWKCWSCEEEYYSMNITINNDETSIMTVRCQFYLDVLYFMCNFLCFFIFRWLFDDIVCLDDFCFSFQQISLKYWEMWHNITIFKIHETHRKPKLRNEWEQTGNEQTSKNTDSSIHQHTYRFEHISIRFSFFVCSN